jgi:hypothetical protein
VTSDAREEPAQGIVICDRDLAKREAIQPSSGRHHCFGAMLLAMTLFPTGRHLQKLALKQ